MTFIKACKHITNYTSGHETLSTEIGEERFSYPDHHIESDNRLSWFLGQLDSKFGDDAYYVHLIRNKEKTVKSHNRRWKDRNSIIKAFAEGILKTPVEKLNDEKKLQISEDYYDCVNANIHLFLKDKSLQQVVAIETVKEDFSIFWDRIGATGSLELALKEFDLQYNKSNSSVKRSFRYRLKLWILKIFRTLRGFTISAD
jgi:hypothetical protein